MKPSERIEKVLKHTGENRSSLARRIGLKPHRIQDIAQERIKEFPYEVADLIVKEFPEISRAWLLSGNGDMLVPKDRPTTSGIQISGSNSIQGATFNNSQYSQDVEQRTTSEAFGFSLSRMIDLISSIHNKLDEVQKISDDKIKALENMQVEQINKLISIIETKDEQIERLLNVIENKQNVTL